MSLHMCLHLLRLVASAGETQTFCRTVDSAPSMCPSLTTHSQPFSPVSAGLWASCSSAAPSSQMLGLRPLDGCAQSCSGSHLGVRERTSLIWSVLHAYAACVSACVLCGRVFYVRARARSLSLPRSLSLSVFLPRSWLYLCTPSDAAAGVISIAAECRLLHLSLCFLFVEPRRRSRKGAEVFGG